MSWEDEDELTQEERKARQLMAARRTHFVRAERARPSHPRLRACKKCGAMIFDVVLSTGKTAQLVWEQCESGWRIEPVLVPTLDGAQWEWHATQHGTPGFRRHTHSKMQGRVRVGNRHDDRDVRRGLYWWTWRVTEAEESGQMCWPAIRRSERPQAPAPRATPPEGSPSEASSADRARAAAREALELQGADRRQLPLVGLH